MSVLEYGGELVVDGVVDHGYALGRPGTLIAIRLRDDLESTAGLRHWADEDAVVEIELSRGDSSAVADLRGSDAWMRLPVLDVSA